MKASPIHLCVGLEAALHSAYWKSPDPKDGGTTHQGWTHEDYASVAEEHLGPLFAAVGSYLTLLDLCAWFGLSRPEGVAEAFEERLRLAITEISASLQEPS